MTSQSFLSLPETGAAPAGRARIGLRLLFVVMGVLAALPLAVVELAESRREQVQLIQRAQEHLDGLAEITAASQEQLVEGMGQFLLAAAAAPPVTSNDLPACARYFRRLQESEPRFANIGLIDLRGHVTCHASPDGDNVYLGDRLYYRSALEHRRLGVGEYARGRITGKHALGFGWPALADDGRVKGVVYASINLSWLVERLHGRSPLRDATVYVTDAAAAVLAASDTAFDRIGEPLPDARLRQAVLARQGGAVSAPPAEEPLVLRAVRPIRASGQAVLYAAVSVPAARVIAPAVQRLKNRLAGIMLIALATGSLIWICGERLLVRPLGRLIEGMRRVEQEDYRAALAQPATRLHELTALQQALGSMVTALDTQRFERDHALEALREREARYRELFEASPQILLVHDEKSLRFLDVNDAALAWYGRTRSEFLAMTLPDLVPPSDRPALLKAIAAREASGVSEPQQVWRHFRKGGGVGQVRVLSHGIAFRGRRARLLMVTDVSEALAAEARVREINEKLEQRVAERTRELELSNQELEAFSYSVSHDLRNPLGAVAMFGQLLSAQLGDTLDAQGQLYLARIEQGVRGMERLIDDLLALAKVTRTELVRGPVDLTALCHAVLEELRERDPGRQVVVTLEDGLNCTGDERLLRRLLANLIGNAWKFTARTPAAQIRIGRQKGNPPDSPPVFFVADNGAGFDMKFAGRLFLPFERLHGDHDFPGTGIGLATVQRIVARHGGRVWAEAAVGQGASFYFIINPQKSPE